MDMPLKQLCFYRLAGNAAGLQAMLQDCRWGWLIVDPTEADS
jgi:hypothetical protein